jgi:hypothetical protein
LGQSELVKRYPREIGIPYFFLRFNVGILPAKYERSSLIQEPEVYTLALSDGPRKMLLLCEVRSKITNFLQCVSERTPIVFLPFEVNEMVGFD